MPRNKRGINIRQIALGESSARRSLSAEISDYGRLHFNIVFFGHLILWGITTVI